MGSGADKTPQVLVAALSGLQPGAACYESLQKFTGICACRWSLSRRCSGLGSHCPTQGLLLGCPAARVRPAGACTECVCVSVICREPGEAALVVCTAPEPGLEGIPAARESTAVHKGAIPAPSSLWSQILTICQAQPSATEASPALHGARSQFRMIKSQSWKWNKGETQQASLSARKKKERCT